MTLLAVTDVTKTYTARSKSASVEALKGISFNADVGEYIAIMGESGSGKSTLLNLIAALDQPTSGQIMLNGSDMAQIKEAASAKFRREHLGFVFQDFDLLDTFDAFDNIALPLVLAKRPLADIKSRINALAPQLGIADLLTHYPYELSGGQQQRVAVARALVTEPELLLADEPTGALDSRTADELLRTFNQINANGQTIVMVTHSAIAASHAERVLFIKDGKIFHQLYRGSLDENAFLGRINDSLTTLLTQKQGVS